MSLILADHFLRVDAFEPHPETFDCLLRNTKERMGAIKTFRMAISDRDRQVVTIRNDELKKRAGNTGARHVMPIAEHDGHVLDHLCKAGTVSVDGLSLQRPINFIKIDVEGYELRVLEGAAKTIKKYRPCIMMEVGKTPPERYDIPTEAPHDFLCDLGMTEWHRIGADRMYKWPNSNISS